MYRAQRLAAAGGDALTPTEPEYHWERPKQDLPLFGNRVVVAGSRKFDDYQLFKLGMQNYLERHFSSQLSDLIFITGFARTGADALIVRFCEESGYPWVRFEAQWDDLSAPGAVVRYRRDGTAYNVRAGYWRNRDMAMAGTNLIAWWDGLSGGTRDMIAQATHLGLTVEPPVLIDTPPRNTHDVWQSQGR